MQDKKESKDRAAAQQELIDQVIAGYQKPADLINENGLLKQITKSIFEAALKAELAEHLGHDKHAPVSNDSGNVRNGHSSKTVTGEFGEIQIAVPHDREGSFIPQLIPKHQRRFHGFDERVLSLYARGISTREIAAHLQELFGAEVSPSLISAITDTVADEVRAWQARPLDALYPMAGLHAPLSTLRDVPRGASSRIMVWTPPSTDGIKVPKWKWFQSTEKGKERPT